jgi:hypothetical protein
MSDSDQTTIQTLHQLSDAMDQESPSVTAVRIDDPVNSIESSVAEFTRDTYRHVQVGRTLQDEIGDEISIRKGEANIKQLMDFYIAVQNGNTMAGSSVLSPLLNIQAARVQAEVETHQTPGSATFVDERVFKKASKDVLQGIVQLNQILEAMHGNAAAVANSVEVVDDKAKKA